MKINSSIFTLALTSVLAIAGCTEQLGDNSSEINGGVPFSFSASHSDSKTSIEGLQTVWDADDDVNLFHAEAGSTSYVNDNAFVITSQNLSTNTFTGTLAAAIEEGKAYDWYVFYPYSEYNKTPAGTGQDNCAYITIGGISQTQDGNNSLAHLSGKNCPLYGVAKSVPASSKLSLTMKHLTSIVEIKVTNNSGAPVKVNSVTFTGTDDIAGTYYINYSDPENVAYTSRGADYVANTAALTVSGGEEIANGAIATFYIAIKPFTAHAGSELKVSVNGDEQIYPIIGDVTFNPGKIKTVKYSIDLPASDEPYPYEESFATDMGKFSINDVSLPAELTYIWKWASADYGMKASAYLNKTNYASESWLISPVIDMSEAVNPELSFDNVARFGSNSNHTLWAREKDGEWSQLTISNYGNGSSWDFVSNRINVSKYAGKSFQFAFKYVSTTSGAGTWEIKNIKLEEGAALESISWSGYTSNYTVGSTFKADGTVTATYSDGSTANVTSAASFSTPDMSTAGTKTVTVTYQGKTTTGTITVRDASNSVFVKVTSEPADWSGDYLIVYEGANVAFNGGLSTLDAISNTIPVTITDGEILVSEELMSAIFTVGPSNGKYFIKSASGYYIGQTANDNGLKKDNSTPYDNTISLDTKGDVDIISSSAHLRYNNASNQKRFRYYKSSSYTSQKAIQLYKLSN